MNIFGIVRNAAALITDQYADKDLKQPNLTLRGNIAVEQILATPTGTTPTVAETDDGSIAAGQVAQLSITENYVFDAINGAAWVRKQALLSNLDGQIATGLAFQGIVARPQALNSAGTFDRLRAQSNAADALATENVGILASNAYPWLFNGVTFDRIRAASASVQALATKIGVLATAKIGDWSINNDPAAATQATVTRAAGAAGVRHICTSIFASFSAGATAGAAVKVYLRDGLTGAGAILWSGSLAVPIGGTENIAVSDLSIVGATATAMTLEFAAAGALTTLQNVSLTGYDTV